MATTKKKNMFALKKKTQPFIGPIGMSKPTPNTMDNAGTKYYSPPPTFKASVPAAKTTVKTTPFSAGGGSSKPTNTNGYSAAYNQGLAAIANFNNRNTTSNTTSTQQNSLADTPIATFYDPTPNDKGYDEYKDVDEDKIRRDVIQRAQGQINATKGAYSRLLQDTQIMGQGRLGENTAQQARGGLLGSDFGQAQTDTTREFNRRGEQDVIGSEATAIASIMAQAESDARADIAAKRAAKQYGYEEYKSYNTQAETRKKENIQKLSLAMLRQAVDPRTMGSQLKDLAKKYKTTENDIINTYLEEQEARKETLADTEYKTVGADSMLYNPQTGEFIQPPGGSMGGGELVTYNGQSYIQNADGSFSEPNIPTNNEQVETMVNQLAFLKDAVAQARIYKDAAGRSQLRRTAEGAVVGATDYTQLESYLNSLKTNMLTIATDPNIKKFFGPQMSNNDVQLMMAGGTTLDPRLNRPEQVEAELLRLEEIFNRLEQAAMQKLGGGGDDFAEEWL